MLKLLKHRFEVIDAWFKNMIILETTAQLWSFQIKLHLFKFLFFVSGILSFLPGRLLANFIMATVFVYIVDSDIFVLVQPLFILDVTFY